MAKFADVRQSIWTEPWFAGLDVDAQHLYLWAISNEHSNLAGLYVVAQSVMQVESRLTERRLDEALHRLSGKMTYRRETGTLWVIGRVKHVRSKGERIATSIATAVANCPDPDIRTAFIEKYGSSGWLVTALAEIASESQLSEPLQGSTMTLADLPSTSPSPSRDVTDNNNASGQGRSVAREDELPEDLAPHLRTAAEQVVSILERIAEAKGAKLVTLAAVGRAVASYPDRDHAKVAGDLEHWLCHGTGENRPAKDVVGYFRNQLDRAPRVTLRAIDGGKARTDYDAAVENR